MHAAAGVGPRCGGHYPPHRGPGRHGEAPPTRNGRVDFQLPAQAPHRDRESPHEDRQSGILLSQSSGSDVRPNLGKCLGKSSESSRIVPLGGALPAVPHKPAWYGSSRPSCSCHARK